MAQCLRSGSRTEVDRIVLTASGGPFRGWTRQQMWDVTPEQAAAHPTWSMGQMNTLNSATLVNKGLELIEASLLFDVPAERIDVTSKSCYREEKPPVETCRFESKSDHWLPKLS